MTCGLDPLRLPLRGSRLIEASAGTGKTWTIAALYLRLVLGHGGDDTRFARPLDPAEILVMTFTRAATRELSDRIRRRLLDAARLFRGDPTAAADPFVADLVASYPDAAARDEAAFRLAIAAEGMDAAAVFTIDAWTGKMLREHAFDSGSLFDETLRADEAAMLAEASRDYWRREVYPLHGAATTAVIDVWKDFETFSMDVAKLVVRVPTAGVDIPLSELLMRQIDRRQAVLGPIKDEWVDHARTMRDWLTSQLNGSGPFDRQKLKPKFVTKWLDSLDLWIADDDRIDPDIAEGGRHRLTPAGLRECFRKDRALDIPEAFERFAALPERLAALERAAPAIRMHAASQVASRLKVLKKRAGIHGFRDLLERLDDALRGPGGARLRERIVAQYPAALIDEFQDTSPTQYRIFDRVYRTAANAPETALLLIGDPKQSIYSFRDTDILGYLRARVDMGDRHEALMVNYRSRPELVGALNRLFERAEARPEGAFRFGPSAAGQELPLPFVAVAAQGIDLTLRDRNGPVAALTICVGNELQTKSDAMPHFAAIAAEHIAVALADRRTVIAGADGRSSALAPADIAVLVRNRNEAAAMRRALQHRGIASAFLSDQESVLASEEALDLRYWLEAVADPLDARRVRVAFATELIGLPLGEVARFGADDQAFERRVDDLMALRDVWVTQGVLAMLRRTLHLLALPARWLSVLGGERRLTNVLHLGELLQAASATIAGPESLIRWFAEQSAIGEKEVEERIVRLESDDALIKIVTIHASKGLEYAIVYLPFVTSFREERWGEHSVAFPADDEGRRAIAFDPDADVKRRVELEADQEDVRLLYVAMTRARLALWVGVAPLRYGRTSECVFERSAFGHLVTGGEAVTAEAIAGTLRRVFDGVDSVVIEMADERTATTEVLRVDRTARLAEAPRYRGVFERDWGIGSFSSLARDLPSLRPSATTMLPVPMDPAIAEEILSGPDDDIPDRAVASLDAPRHRFPRGALAGNFLHEQLEWLATKRFALAGDDDLEKQLAGRCDHQGWGYRTDDAVTWLREICETALPPIGASLSRLPHLLAEMEFWLPNEPFDSSALDRLCRDNLLDGRERPALAARRLNGMIMGFADLAFEADGRYWVVDYKSNALGTRDADYTSDALARSMADNRYDVQGALYLLALHRLLRQRLGPRYDPRRDLGGALYFYLRGIRGPVSGCFVLPPSMPLLDALDALLTQDATT